MNFLITICGRGGSKGLENKNIRPFLGRPLMEYTIAAARRFRVLRPEDHIDICVSSDSRELLSIGRQYGVVCVERPADLAEDLSPKVPSIRHALVTLEELLQIRYDAVIDLDITSPLRRNRDIEAALAKLLEKEETDVVFSVVPSRRNPYFNMVEVREGKVQKVIDAYFPSRQAAPKIYDMNASIYCYRRDSLREKLERSPLDGNFDQIIMKDTCVLDIDSEEDFRLLELLAGGYFKEEYREVFDDTYLNSK